MAGSVAFFPVHFFLWGCLCSIAASVFMLPALAATADCPAATRLSKEQISIVGAKTRSEFTVEIADTGHARSAGLMCRRQLKKNSGMLFVYPEPQLVKMWMKNTVIALDMLFIAADGRIVKIAGKIAAEQPGKISSEEPVMMVLELPAGSVERHGIQPGDRVLRD